MLGPRRVARKRGVAACGGITAFTLGRAVPGESEMKMHLYPKAEPTSKARILQPCTV